MGGDECDVKTANVCVARIMGQLKRVHGGGNEWDVETANVCAARTMRAVKVGAR